MFVIRSAHLVRQTQRRQSGTLFSNDMYPSTYTLIYLCSDGFEVRQSFPTFAQLEPAIAAARAVNSGRIVGGRILLPTEDTSFAAKLRTARIAAGLTYAQAAEVVGVCRRTLQYWEGGKQEPLQPTQTAVLGALEAKRITNMAPDTENMLALLENGARYAAEVLSEASAMHLP